MEFALVHGAYHGAWCWDLVVPELADRGHTVVTVNLPITDPTAGTEAYADVVIEEIDGMDAPVVVGHSMAGLVIPLVAASRPIGLMVFLAAFLPEPGSSLGDQRAREPIDPDTDMTSARFTHLGDGVFEIGEETARRMFFHDVRRDVQDWAIGNLRPQAYRFMDEVTPLQAWPNCRAEYIVCTDDHAVNADWGREAAMERLGLEPLVIQGSHSPFLSRPAELASMLDSLAS